MAALQRLGQSSLSTSASSYVSCKAGGMAVLDQFPAGLRVLVVDDDLTCLRILEQMLRRCLYNGSFSFSSMFCTFVCVELKILTY